MRRIPAFLRSCYLAPTPRPPLNRPPASYKCRPLYLFAQKDESKEGVGVISLWLNLTETTAKSMGPLPYINSTVHIIIIHFFSWNTVLVDFFLFDPETLTKGEWDEIFDFLGFVFDEPVSFIFFILLHLWPPVSLTSVGGICCSFVYLLWKICNGSGD